MDAEKTAIMFQRVEDLHKAIMGNGKPGLMAWATIMEERLKDYEEVKAISTSWKLISRVVLFFLTPTTALAMLLFVFKVLTSL